MKWIMMKGTLVPVAVVLCFVSFLLLQGCEIRGLTNDFNKMQPANQARLASGLPSLEQLRNPSETRIYFIDTAQLFELMRLRGAEYNLVIPFMPLCRGEGCTPLDSIYAYAARYDFEPWVIMANFDDIIFSNSTPRNYFTVDPKLYKTKFVLKYLPKFLKSISGGLYDSDGTTDNCFFKGETFLRTVNLLSIEKEMGERRDIRDTVHHTKDNPSWSLQQYRKLE